MNVEVTAVRSQDSAAKSPAPTARARIATQGARDLSMHACRTLSAHAILVRMRQRLRTASTHDQGVEHAKAAHHAARYQRDAKHRAAHQLCDIRPSPGAPRARRKASDPHRGKRQNISNAKTMATATSIAADNALRALELP